MVQVDHRDTVAGTGTSAPVMRMRPADGMLRRALVTSDAAAAGAAWTLALLLTAAEDLGGDPATLATWSLVGSLVTVSVLAREQLYLTRVWAVRALEMQRVGRASLIAAVLLLAVDRLVSGPVSVPIAVFAIVLTCTLVVASRSALLTRLRATPDATDDHRSLLLADDVDEAHRVVDLLTARPGLGYHLVGFVSARRPATATAVPWIGTPADLPVLTRLTAATSVVVAGDAFASDRLDEVLEQLQPLDVHTHLIASDADDALHVKVLPLTHRGAAAPVAPALTAAQRIAKRAFDVVAGGLLAVVTLPVLAVAVTMLKVATGGPVLVRDVRLGPRGEPVIVRRLRVRHLPDTAMAEHVGRICRWLAIDKLPQLANVLAGSMTLVGPRPRRRPRAHPTPIDVSAGLIGLRHVETPDYPELGTHRRTDAFYIENWSIGLDLSIVAACASDLVWRTVRHLVRDRSTATATI